MYYLVFSRPEERRRERETHTSGWTGDGAHWRGSPARHQPHLNVLGMSGLTQAEYPRDTIVSSLSICWYTKEIFTIWVGNAGHRRCDPSLSCILRGQNDGCMDDFSVHQRFVVSPYDGRFPLAIHPKDSYRVDNCEHLQLIRRVWAFAASVHWRPFQYVYDMCPFSRAFREWEMPIPNQFLFLRKNLRGRKIYTSKTLLRTGQQ